jgi:Mg2+ and Co2+ transporter CorA
MVKGAKHQPSTATSHLMWIDIANVTADAGDEIRKAFNLHPVTVDDVLEDGLCRLRVFFFMQTTMCVCQVNAQRIVRSRENGIFQKVQRCCNE